VFTTKAVLRYFNAIDFLLEFRPRRERGGGDLGSSSRGKGSIFIYASLLLISHHLGGGSMNE
jgi:hypothetical protein